MDTVIYIHSQEYIKLRIKDFVINSKEGDADNQDSDDDVDDFYHYPYFSCGRLSY